MLLSAFYYTYDLLNMFRESLAVAGYAAGRKPSHTASQPTLYHHQDPRSRRSMW
jgi:hypothetical protein